MVNFPAAPAWLGNTITEEEKRARVTETMNKENSNLLFTWNLYIIFLCRQLQYLIVFLQIILLK